MVKAVLLDNVAHHDLRLVERRGPEFGDGLNETPVFATEIVELQREYPIYFRRTEDGGGFQAFAMLGLDAGENLYVDDGVWRARRIPAMLERGPFALSARSRDDSQGPMMMVDLDHPRISRNEGAPLFRPQGGNSVALERCAAALRTIHVGFPANEAMFAAFLAAGLIAPIQIDIRLDDRTQYALQDVYSISAQAIEDLPADALAKLNAGPFLGLAFYIIASAGNIARLIELKNKKRAQG